jgi:pyruvate dehydrogenase E2 component (dihydrolipoamide acetyltransferase)
MATDVKLPRLGQGMESGTIVRWLKAEGDAVTKNEPLYELDTDKVTQEVESDIDGVLLKIVVAEGEVDVGSTIAVIGKDGEDLSLEAGASTSPDEGVPSSPEEGVPSSPEEGVPSSPEPVAEEEAPAAAPARPQSEPKALSAEDKLSAEDNGKTASSAVMLAGGRVKASPLARRIARERGIDLASLPGTGPDGRIVAEDVENAPAGGAAALASLPASTSEIEVVAMTSIRKTIARRLTEAWTAPVFQLGVSIDMTEALHLREQLVARLPEGDVKPTVNDLLTRLVGVALVRHRAVNATFTGEEIHRHPGAHIGMAVAAPSGLMVPVIRDADRRSVQEIARARADLVGRARAGKLTLQDMEGGTFTISNLGMFGVEQFVAVLNPPQVAILAVGAVKQTPVVVDGEIDVAPLMQVTLTCDHRAIDGADGADFLRTLVALVEQPALAL